MEAKTKTLLKLSIQEFKAAESSQQDDYIKHVENQLENAEYFADHYVQAGKIFLRLFKPRKLFTLTAYGFKAEAVQKYTGANYNVSIHIKRSRELMYGYDRKHTDGKTKLLKECLTWMRKNRPGAAPVKDNLYFAVQSMVADQQTSINNKI